MTSLSQSNVFTRRRTLPFCFHTAYSSEPVGIDTAECNDTSAPVPPVNDSRINNDPLPDMSENPDAYHLHVTNLSVVRDIGLSTAVSTDEVLNDLTIDSTSASNPRVDESTPNDTEVSSSNPTPPDNEVLLTSPSPLTSCTSSDEVADSSTCPQERLACRYGTACYRQNVQHRAEFSHPGDEDYKEEETQCSSTTDANTDKPACWYGNSCYRRNAEHLAAYSHNFTSSGRPKRTTNARLEISHDSDESEELDDFSDSDEYEASFIDDSDSSEDLDSEVDDVSDASNGTNMSEDDEVPDSSKKRKKHASKKKNKKKRESSS